MIQPLRRRHRRIFILLGAVLPLLFVAGILARMPAPRAGSLPADLTGTSAKFTVTKSEQDNLFVKTPMRVRLLREQANAGGWAVSLFPAGNFARPDVLVYWAAGSLTATGSLPGQARLLGPLTAPALPLPQETATTNGTLILYSLADDEILDYSHAITFGDTP